MTWDVPYGMGCPSCSFTIEVSTEDPDASLSYMHSHIFDRHSGYDRPESNRLLAQVRDLTEAEMAL